MHGGDIADESHRTDFDYLNTGITSREDYMLRYSYCCLVRCFDIIRNQPKCNSTINVWGGSQGGGLTLVLGGLRPATSLAGHNIALCRIDWTILGLTRWGPQLPKGEDPQKIAAIVAYYDPARFTHRIHSAVKLCFGLFDWCAPGEGIMSAVNGLPKDTRVEVFADPFGDHFHSTYERANKGAPAIEIPRWQGTDADNKVSNQPRH